MCNMLKQKMMKPVLFLAEQLAGIRSGTLSVGFVETFKVTIEGTTQTIGSIAAISCHKERITIRPYDPAATHAISKSLIEGKLNAYVSDKRSVCVGIPPISGEQRQEIAKHVRKLGEEAKVSIRAIRQDFRKKQGANADEKAVQKITDDAVAEAERLVNAKITEIGQ